MKLDSGQHKRLSLHLSNYDYTKPGCYFITIRSQNSEHLFGKISKNKLILNIYGEIVIAAWHWLEIHYPYIRLDVWTLMPNHLHGIICYEYFEGRGECSGRSRTATTLYIK